MEAKFLHFIKYFNLIIIKFVKLVNYLYTFANKLT